MKTIEVQPPSRREANRQNRREAIIEVASRSFLEDGYAGTTMSAIAARLGGSKGTLWNYFPSKEVLFEAVLDRATTEFRAQLTLILDPADDLEHALGSFCHEFISKVTSPVAIALNRLVVGEVNRFPEIGKIFYERGPRRTHTLLADFLTGAMNRGLLRRTDPVRCAQQLNAMCMSGCHQQLMMGVIDAATPDMINDDAQRTLDTFMRAYAA
jgi:AcrR family transcriptional regulator